MRNRVSKLSVPSRMTSNPLSNSSALRGPTSATTPSTPTAELTLRSLRSAATTFGSASRASASSKSVCRCKFVGSTKSRSTTRSRPTPARASRFAAAGPIAGRGRDPRCSATLTNRMVASSRIVTPNGRVRSESPEGLAIRVGQPLDASALREVLRQLYRTGDYAVLQAVLAELPGGLRLDFVVRENLFFNEIRFEGLVSPPSEASAAAAMQINLGQPYRKELLDEALVRLQDALREEGFYNAKLSAETIPHTDTLQMDVVVHVQPGRRARAGTIQLVNDTEYPDRELIARSRLKPGQEITTARLQRAGDRVRKFLAKKGHLSARASIRRSEYIPEKNAVPLDLEIAEGPLVRVVVTGAKLSHGKIRSLVPVYQEGAVDPDLLEEGRRNILEQLERDTYFDARVTYTTEQKEISRKTHAGPSTEELITYRIERGERHHLIGIEITGNRYFSDELLRGRLKLVADGV